MNMMKRFYMTFLLFLPALLLACGNEGKADPETPEGPPGSVVPDAENILSNWNMEEDVSMDVVSLPFYGNWGYIGGWNGQAATPYQMDGRGVDGSRCLATRDIRLARRLVRDFLFRGHRASFTLGLWGHVCNGEERYIKPYKPRADLLLDTTHTYEVCLWRNVLDSMPPDPALTSVQQRQLEALCRKFVPFPALGTELVPQDSMLREFIGPQGV